MCGLLLLKLLVPLSNKSPAIPLSGKGELPKLRSESYGTNKHIVGRTGGGCSKQMCQIRQLPDSVNTLMPRCPSCGKGGFATHNAISRHMSQQKSGCSTWFDNLVRIHEDLLGRDHDGPNHSPHTTSIDEQFGDIGEYNPWVNSDEEMLDGTREDNSESSPIEYFPGAAQAFVGGSTFLDRFEADQFSNCRSSNIYYPFASRGDWQMGSWLLRSGLSMSAINTFLSLDLVCFFC